MISVKCLWRLFLCMVLVTFKSSAQPTIRGPITYPKKLSVITTITILPIAFDCYHLTAGGIRQYDDSISSVVRMILTDHAERIIANNKFSVRRGAEDQSTIQPWLRHRQFYSVVNSSILNHFFGDGAFPRSRKNFTFVLPPFPDSLVSGVEEAVLFINGFDDRSTKKRGGAKVGAAVASTFGVASAMLIGFGGTMHLTPDMTFATCALVNKKGQLIWYNRAVVEGNRDMANSEHAEKLVRFLLKDLSKEVKKRSVPDSPDASIITFYLDQMNK